MDSSWNCWIVNLVNFDLAFDREFGGALRQVKHAGQARMKGDNQTQRTCCQVASEILPKLCIVDLGDLAIIDCWDGGSALEVADGAV